ncbi:MAG: hypothetical protein FJ011_02805 [Chloroflexi bacterium]|nr:hypothetical protein [Chloroflexota bacterium]
MKRSTDETLALALDDCYERLAAGESVAACMERYAEHAGELRPLLGVLTAVMSQRATPLRSPQVAARARARFIYAANQLRNQPASLRDRLATWWAEVAAGLAGPRLAPAGLWAVLLSFVLVGALFAGAVTASADALPGDLLYPVKLGVEQARLGLTLDPAMRSALSEQFDQWRIREAQAVAEQGRIVTELQLRGEIEALGADEWLISGQRVIITEETEIVGAPAVGARVEGTMAARGDGAFVARQIRIKPGQRSSRAPAPTATPPPAPTPTPLPSSPPTATATAAPSHTPVVSAPAAAPAATETASPTSTPTSSATPTRTPTATPTITRTPTASPTLALMRTAHFVDEFVHSINGNVWQIGAWIVVIEPETRIIDNPTVGDQVSGAAWVYADETYHAIEIRKTPKPVQFGFTGIVRSIQGNVWTVFSDPMTYVFFTGPDTRIGPGIGVGTHVKVDAEQRSTGVWAREISAIHLAERHISGYILSQSGGLWNVSGRMVRVDGETQIEGNAVVGSYVDVRGLEQPDGILLAKHVFVHPATATPTATRPSTATPTAPVPTATPSKRR